jgi:hypothetical protein
MAQGLSTVQTRPWQPGERPPLEQPDDAGRIISWLCRCFPGKASSRAILSFDRYCGAYVFSHALRNRLLSSRTGLYRPSAPSTATSFASTTCTMRSA